jgi:hypothetical protein
MLESGPKLSDAIHSVKYTSPNYEHEGMAGYISTDVVFDVKDIVKFAELYDSWFKLDSTVRLSLYDLAKKGRHCK